MVTAEFWTRWLGLRGSPAQSLSSRHGSCFDTEHQHALLTGTGLSQRGDGRCRKGPTGVCTAISSPTAAHPDPHASPRNIHPKQSSLAGHGHGTPGVVGFWKRPGHQRVSQIGTALDPSATLRLPIDLGHVFKVNEVAEAQRRQVQPGLLTVVCCLDCDAHVRVVRRPTAGVVLPLPQPALTWCCVRVVEATSHRSKGSWCRD